MIKTRATADYKSLFLVTSFLLFELLQSFSVKSLENVLRNQRVKLLLAVKRCGWGYGCKICHAEN